MKTFIYGTGNPAKLAHMKNMLAPLDVKIIGLKETGIAIPEVNGNGSTPLENARIKALAYYSVQALQDEGIVKVALVVFTKNEVGNDFWEQRGFISREDLNYRNRTLNENLIRMDT